MRAFVLRNVVLRRILNKILLCFALVVPVSFAGEPGIERDMSYVSDGLPDQRMDVYWPENAPSAAILFIHGGSLQESGERRSSPVYRDVCRPFADAGLACATIDYRLAPRYQWPAMPNDVASALSKLRALVAKHGGDPQQLFLFGHSSGCHLAAVLATNRTYLELVGLKPSDLAGVIAMGCTLDRYDAALRGITVDQIRKSFEGDREEVATYGTPENWMSANPARYVGHHVPPTLVLVARSERFMPPVLEQGARFVRLLLEFGVPAELEIVPGTHINSVSSMGQPGNLAFKAILEFVQKKQLPVKSD